MDTEAAEKLNALEAAAGTASTAEDRITALCALAREQWAQGLTLSLATAQQARQVASGSGSALGLARSLCTEGYLCGQQGKSAQAQARLTEALQLIQSRTEQAPNEPMPKELEAECRHFLGLGHYRASAYEPALEHFLQAQTLYLEADDPAGLAQILNDLGNLYLDMSDFTEALSFYRASLACREANGDRRGVACSLHNIALIRAEMQDAAQALRSYEQCLAAARETKYVRLEMRCLAHMSAVYASLNQWEAAFEASRTALALARTGGHRDNEGMALCAWADTHKLAGQPECAVPLYQQALSIAEEAGDLRVEREIQVNLGECFLAMEQWPEAQAAFLHASELAAAADNKPAAFRAFLGLSEVSRQENNFKQALEFYQKFHLTQQEVLSASTENRTKALLIQMQVKQVRKDAEIERLRSIELVQANNALEHANRTLQEQARQLEFQTTVLQAQSEALARQAAEDGLTGLANRRHLEEWLAQQFAQARCTHCPLTVVMADVDHFKQINDCFGHQIGDEVLMSVAMLMRHACRATDLAARYGGEEFVLVLPETAVSQAHTVCERLRNAVELHPWNAIRSGLSVTISLGLSSDRNAPSHERLLGLADAQLYAAKRAGRNRISSGT